MPGGRRNTVNRTGPTGRSSSSNVNAANAGGRSNSGERASAAGGADDKRLEEIYSGKSLAPKHIPIPEVPVDGQLSFETLSLAVSIIAACLQLLNLYKTVWWLPNSYNGYSMVRCVCIYCIFETRRFAILDRIVIMYREN